MKKRILSILLTLCVVMSLVPLAVLAAEGDTDITEVNLNGLSSELWSYKDLTFATVDDDAGYTIKEQAWNASYEMSITPDSASLKPKAGKEYTFIITLEAKDGYVFPIKSETNVFYDGTVRLDGTEYDGGVATVSTGGKTLKAVLFPLTKAKGVTLPEETVSSQSELAAALENPAIRVIQLVEDIDISYPKAVSRTVTLDLNGYALSSVGTRIFEINNGGHLTVIDSRPNEKHLFGIDSQGRWLLYRDEDETVLGGVICSGMIDGGGGGVKVNNGGSLTMNGGSIVGCGSPKGGGVYVDGGVFEMNEGAAILGCITRNGEGGGVYVASNGTFTMNGGEIRGCAAKNGSGVYLYGGTMNVAGGTVDGTVVVDEAYDSASYSNIPGVIRSLEDNTNATRFKGDVTNDGEIRHGIFSGKVTGSSGSVISGGTFNGEVVNETGIINGGTFNGKVTSNGGTINNGTFNGVVDFFRYPTHDGFSNVIVNGGSFTETSTVNNSGCTIHNGTYSGKVTVIGWLEPPDGFGTTGVIMGGTFTETSEVTALTTPHRNLVGIICCGDFYGKVKLEGGIISNFGRNKCPVFHESSKVYFTSGSASGGIYYGTEIYGDANVGGGAYCIVAFKTGGGSEVPEQKVLRGKKLPPHSAKTTKTGYVFSGWLRNGTPFDLTATPLIDHDVELTAVWSECDHTGNTAKPTCTVPAACTVCGGTIAAPGHDFSASVWQHDEDTHWKKCSRCDAKNDEHPHDWDAGRVTKPASCVVSGEKTYTCSECGVTKIEPIDAKGHQYGEAWQYDVTHHWRACGNCDQKLDYARHTGGKATCTEKAVCTFCGEAYGEVDANNHADLKHIEAKAATEEAEGNIEYWYCESCGKYYSDAAATKEITTTETVTAKVKSPQTGDTGSRMLWFALLFISGGAGTALTVKRKNLRRYGGNEK